MKKFGTQTAPNNSSKFTNSTNRTILTAQLTSLRLDTDMNLFYQNNENTDRPLNEINERVVLGEIPVSTQSLSQSGGFGFESKGFSTENEKELPKSSKSKPLGMDLTFIKNGSELTIPVNSGPLQSSIYHQSQTNQNKSFRMKDSVFEAIEEQDELKNTLTSKNSSVLLSNLKLRKISDNANLDLSTNLKSDPEVKSNPMSVDSSYTPQKVSKRSEENLPKSSRRAGKSVSRNFNKSPFKSPYKLSDMVKKNNLSASQHVIGQYFQSKDFCANSQLHELELDKENLYLGINQNEEISEKFESEKERELNKTETLKKLITCNMSLKQSRTTTNLQQTEMEENDLRRLPSEPVMVKHNSEGSIDYLFKGLDLASKDPSYTAICYQEYHNIELKFRQMLEERDDRFQQILEMKDKRIEELTKDNEKLQKKIEDIKLQLFV